MVNYDVLVQSLAREVRLISNPHMRAEVIATLYLAGLHADGYCSQTEKEAASNVKAAAARLKAAADRATPKPA